MDQEVLGQLKEIREELKRLSGKIDIALQSLKKHEGLVNSEYSGILERETKPLDVATLLSLKDHLRKTAMVMLELRKATAEMVMERTGRRRATESDCLNQLVRMGYLKKKREGLKVFFHI